MSYEWLTKGKRLVRLSDAVTKKLTVYPPLEGEVYPHFYETRGSKRIRRLAIPFESGLYLAGAQVNKGRLSPP